MVNLCENLQKQLKNVQPAQSVHLKSCNLLRYEDSEICKILEQSALLNLLLKDYEGKYEGIDISTSLNGDLGKFCGNLNVSHVVEIRENKNEILAFHWDGFRSVISISPFSIVSQVFTK